VNQKMHVACNFESLIETKGFFMSEAVTNAV